MAWNIISWLCLFSLCVYYTSCNNGDPSSSGIEVPKQPWANCRILFNEVDFATTQHLGFIELSKFCNAENKQAKNSDLKDFKVVYINAAGEIIISCQLSGSMTFKKDDTRVKVVDSNTAKRRTIKQKKEYFFTIGERDVANANLRFSDCQRDEEFAETLPSGEAYPFGILLLYQERGTEYNSISLIPDTTSKTKYRRKTLNGRHMEKINRHIQDFYQFGSITPFSTCDVFTSLCKYSQNPSKILRDWNPVDGDLKSLNRCGREINPFNPDAWKYSFPSPGNDNFCANAVEFSLEELVPQMVEPRQENVDLLNVCIASNLNPAATELEIDEQSLDNLFHENADEGNNNQDDVVINLEESEDDAIPKEIPENINSYLNFYDESLVRPNYKYIWEDCKNVNPQMLEKMSNDIDVTHVLHANICPWIAFNEDETKHVKATCSFCKTLHEKGVLVERDSSPLLSTFLKSGHWHLGPHRKTQNRDMILEHSTNPLHLISMQYYKQLDDGMDRAEFNKAMMAETSTYYKFYAPTERFIISIYQSVRLGLPFLKFPVLAEILKFANYDMGHLHATPQGAKKGLKVISECMHKELLYHLKTNKPYFSIVIDDSTDIAGISNSEILIQTYNADKHIQTYHYSLLQLKSGMTGSAIFNTFYTQIQKDKLEDILHEKAIGMTSDGALTLKNVFFDELQGKTKHHLIFQHCQAHRLELLIKHSLKPFAYLKTVDNKINQIALQFNNKATKKKALLKQEARKVVSVDENGQVQPHAKAFEIRRIHRIRWINHKASAYQSVLDHWVELVNTNKIILTRKDFTKKSKTRATKLLSYLLDPTFLSHVGFLADIGKIFSKMSMELQVQNSNLIGKMRLRSELLFALQNYEVDGGYYLNKILKHAVTVEDDTNGPILLDSTRSELMQKLRQFEFSENVLNGTNLNEPTEDNKANNTLVEHFTSYFESMYDNLEDIFDPDDVSDSFDVFDPLNIVPLGKDDNTGKNDLQLINVNYQLNHPMNSLYESWKTLVNSIVAEPKFQENRNLRPEKFWIYYLQAPNIRWSESIRNIIEKALVMPPTSSSAERIFSLVTALKPSKRYSLETNTMDAELRIKFNGEKNISRINSFAYARQFIQQYTKVDDLFRASTNPTHEDELRVDGARMRSIFEKPQI